MKRIAFLFLFVFTTTLLFSAHNFTINEETSTTVSLGDDLELYFEYESIGNTASMSILIDVPVIDTSDLDFIQGDLIDGGPFDSTPVDGVFQGSITAFWQPPAGIPLLLTVIDEDIAAEATVTFEALNSTFSISGNISQESDYGFDLPLYPALINVLYNTDIYDFEGLNFEGGIDEWMTFFEDRYLISEVNSFLGNYTVAIPDSIADVPCIVMPISLLDFEATHTSPDPYFDLFNGTVSNIDFLYTLPDGIFSGVVMDGEGSPITGAVIDVYCEELNESAFSYSDSAGEFSLPLHNGTYSLMVAAWEYEPYLSEFTLNNQDVYLDIYLEAVSNDNEDIHLVSSLEVSTYPNPFSESLKISVKSSAKELTSLKVYNLKGQLVKTISTSGMNLQNYSWDGKDDNNKVVANGIYYLRIKQDREIVNKKILLIK